MLFPYHLNTKEMAMFVWETFSWHLRSAFWPPLWLLEDHHDLCPDFILADAEEAIHDFCTPELVMATFYAMLVNKALELGVLSINMATVLNPPLQVCDGSSSKASCSEIGTAF